MLYRIWRSRIVHKVLLDSWHLMHRPHEACPDLSSFQLRLRKKYFTSSDPHHGILKQPSWHHAHYVFWPIALGTTNAPSPPYVSCQQHELAVGHAHSSGWSDNKQAQCQESKQLSDASALKAPPTPSSVTVHWCQNIIIHACARIVHTKSGALAQLLRHRTSLQTPWTSHVKAFLLAYLLTLFLTFYLSHFWHSFWHICWHSFWHLLWHSFWHSFRHSCWHIFWHILWHSFRHSLCYIFWRSFRHICGHSFWRILWQIFWHSFPHSCWDICWHSFWHIFWH